MQHQIEKREFIDDTKFSDVPNEYTYCVDIGQHVDTRAEHSFGINKTILGFFISCNMYNLIVVKIVHKNGLPYNPNENQIARLRSHGLYKDSDKIFPEYIKEGMPYMFKTYTHTSTEYSTRFYEKQTNYNLFEFLKSKFKAVTIKNHHIFNTDIYYLDYAIFYSGVDDIYILYDDNTEQQYGELTESEFILDYDVNCLLFDKKLYKKVLKNKPYIVPKHYTYHPRTRYGVSPTAQTATPTLVSYAYYFKNKKSFEDFKSYVLKYFPNHNLYYRSTTDTKLVGVIQQQQSMPVDTEMGEIHNKEMLAEIIVDWSLAYENGGVEKLKNYMKKSYIHFEIPISKKYSAKKATKYRVYIKDRKFISMLKLDRNLRESGIKKIVFNVNRYDEVYDLLRG